jgi:hypothetical protein
VRVATDNVLDLFSRIEPLKIITKPKLHLLTHLPDNIKRYGPLVGEATEVFECFITWILSVVAIGCNDHGYYNNREGLQPSSFWLQ